MELGKRLRFSYRGNVSRKDESSIWLLASKLKYAEGKGLACQEMIFRKDFPEYFVSSWSHSANELQ